MQHNPQPYSPHEIFTGKGERLPRVFVSPQRYIQGAGVINHVGRYLSLLNAKRAGVLMSKRGQGTDGVRILDSLRSSNIDPVVSTFGGECSLEEIEHHVSNLAKEGLDCLIAVGGGKCVDAGKSIAYRLGVSVVILPTLASNDAPCSALSVLYDTAGVSVGAEFFPDNPALVIVDTQVVAAASERYLVSGMGDAMATWYEARVCLNNPQATSMVGARPTLASCAMGEICAQTLFEQGESAASAVAKGMVDDNLENIVEANTLLSGIGFESGGLALAHAIAQSLTAVPVAHDNYLHGEHVAIGTMVQLMMEQHVDTERVAKFFAKVGLPVHLGQISLSREDQTAMRTIVEATVSWPTSHNMPIPVNDQSIRSALVSADELGLSVAASVGDEAYRRLQK
ncbi:MAG: glycerol dehydrogenase [Pseudomonadales bacterium]|nr:glycerol dehydrogenase [Pseudomonadales bacterium]